MHKNSKFIQDVHKDAVHAAFLIVYSMREKLEKAAAAIENPGPGRNAYVTSETSAATVTLPAYARPAVHVRLAKNQILGAWRSRADRKTNEAIDHLIAISFINIDASKKPGFRQAFKRFKSSTI